MPRPTRLQIARADILAALQLTGIRVFTRSDLDQLVTANRSSWRLATKTTTSNLIDFLIGQGELRKVTLSFPYRPATRYVRQETPFFEIVQSVRTASYFSHYSAIFLHGLTDQLPRSVYLNTEQRGRSAGVIASQDAIDAAFRRPARETSNVTEFEGHRIYLLNGQNTGRLGVVTERAGDGSRVQVTNLERTLIDIAVRPNYSGGVFEVAQAYERAREMASINRLAQMLRQIDFSYPYHQAIGFYLENAGYSENQLRHFRDLPIDHNFYLAHGASDLRYVERWKLFVPKGL